MQLLSKFYKRIRVVLCFIDIYGKSAWVIPSKDKKGIAITNTFEEIVRWIRRQKNHKTKKNKGWVDKGSEFYNTSMKSWLQDNNIEKYSAHSEGISFVEPQRTKFMSIWILYQKKCISIT